MSFQPTLADVSVIITNAALGSAGSGQPSFVTERRITPSWTVEQVKAKLETMTGIPPSCQRLRVKTPGRADEWADDNGRLIGDWGLVKGTEIEVSPLPPDINAVTLVFMCTSIFSNGSLLLPLLCGLRKKTRQLTGILGS